MNFVKKCFKCISAIAMSVRDFYSYVRLLQRDRLKTHTFEVACTNYNEIVLNFSSTCCKVFRLLLLLLRQIISSSLHPRIPQPTQTITQPVGRLWRARAWDTSSDSNFAATTEKITGRSWESPPKMWWAETSTGPLQHHYSLEWSPVPSPGTH